MNQYLPIAALSFLVLSACGYVTHIFWTLSHLLGPGSIDTKMAVIMGLGAIVTPFGVIHGVYIWF